MKRPFAFGQLQKHHYFAQGCDSIRFRPSKIYILLLVGSCVLSGAPWQIWARQSPIFYPKFFFDRLFLMRAYWNPKSRQGPGLEALPAMAPLHYFDKFFCLLLNHFGFNWPLHARVFSKFKSEDAKDANVFPGMGNMFFTFYTYGSASNIKDSLQWEYVFFPFYSYEFYSCKDSLHNLSSSISSEDVGQVQIKFFWTDFFIIFIIWLDLPD